MKQIILALMLMFPQSLLAQEMWADIRGLLFEERPVSAANNLIVADIPHRTSDDLRTDISAFVQAPVGQWLGKVWLVIDNNPMPVSAVFEFSKPLSRFFFKTTMRINGQSPVHVVMETTSGQLFVAEHFVKTSGTGACAAPPGTDPDLALETLGQMDLSVGRLKLADTLHALSIGNTDAQLDIDLSHPSHSGLQKDQLSLLFIPFRYVETMDIELDDAPYVKMDGSISMSENPSVGISIPGATRKVGVTMTDTDGTVSQAEIKLGNN